MPHLDGKNWQNGVSLYFAILSLQGKSPFYSYLESIAIYFFGAINIIFVIISLGTLLPIYFGSYHGTRNATFVVFAGLALLLIDMLVNNIIFVVHKEKYVDWCINSASGNLDSILRQKQIMIGSGDGTQEASFSTNMGDFYNCSRTWEDELKFSAMMTLVISTVYIYWSISLYSYSHKLRIELARFISEKMNAGMPMMVPVQGAPIVAGADMMLQ
ncbi:hypothetical protein [Parasitella parasitica]|uniref:Uncharacterized protein n=1 Tax=Parasitella parasitica TaxID=35722 RepID=A0A0B7NLZ2_9FUNG|nr:hypothetical protein [Parasitella parasitica]